MKLPSVTPLSNLIANGTSLQLLKVGGNLRQEGHSRSYAGERYGEVLEQISDIIIQVALERAKDEEEEKEFLDQSGRVAAYGRAWVAKIGNSWYFDNVPFNQPSWPAGPFKTKRAAIAKLLEHKCQFMGVVKNKMGGGNK